MLLHLILVTLLLNYGKGARILLVTVPGRSHVHYFATAGNELVQRGHEVHVLLSTADAKLLKDLKDIVGPSMTIHHVAGDDKNPFDEESMAEQIKTIVSTAHKLKLSNAFEFWIMGFMMKFVCNDVLNDEQLFLKLQNLKFDIAMIDGFPGCRCQYVLLHRLGIPYVSLTTQYEPWQFGIPALPSTVPLALIHDFDEKMTFTQRVRNFLSYIQWHTIPLVYTMSGHYTSQYAPELPYKTPNQLAAESAIWFINTDIAIDYARPSAPHVIEVGGLTTGPPNKPLPKEFQTFMDNSGDDGVILISFGSMPGFPDELEQLIHDTVLRLNHRVIWKTSQHNLTSASTITSKWIPQNAILAHPNTKLFITHGGNNGQFESLYHAVPMIVIPLFGDQFYNAQRAKYKGYCLSKEAFGTTVEELLEGIEEVMKNPIYKENIERGSQIFRSHPMNPKERLVYWIEHVIEYGSDHLHSYSLKMPWYQYWMIDIVAFVFGCLTIVLCAFYVLVRACMRKKSKNLKMD